MTGSVRRDQSPDEGKKLDDVETSRAGILPRSPTPECSWITFRLICPSLLLGFRGYFLSTRMSRAGGVSPPAQRLEPSSHAGDLGPARRHLSIFDAVTGTLHPSIRNVVRPGFWEPTLLIQTSVGLASLPGFGSTSLSAAVPPEEVLFRRKDAPDRYAENDFYWADKHLPPSARLPESDLLKAVHAYTADYYAQTSQDGGKIDARSMNETALVAMGILLEEAMVQILGERGDMALVEGESVGSEERHENVHSSEASGQSWERVRKSPPHRVEAHERTKHKRRRLEGTREHAEASGIQSQSPESYRDAS